MNPETSPTVIVPEAHFTEGQPLTGKIVALLAGLSAISILSTNSHFLLKAVWVSDLLLLEYLFFRTVLS
ncbi:hypothetical protein [Pantoea sp. B65]|uniref:hypothetical protein n=1 Tax=Pantoea sp. B65 TaxID=2813359 RepID=UPI0039B45E57